MGLSCAMTAGRGDDGEPSALHRRAKAAIKDAWELCAATEAEQRHYRPSSWPAQVPPTTGVPRFAPIGGGSQSAWMRCRIDARGPVIVVRIAGEMTTRYASMLEVALNWRGDGYKPIVLDCANLANIDRTAADALVRIYAESKALEIPFAIVAPQRSIRTMFGVLGLRHVLPIFRTMDEAVRQLNGSVPDARPESEEHDGGDFECTLKAWHGASVVTVRGDFDLSTTRHIEEVCSRTNDLPLVINLSSIKYIDSSGFQTLVEIQQRCSDRGAGFALAFTSRFLRHLFSVLALDRELRVFPSVDAAVAYLTGATAQSAAGPGQRA